jgi:hypothetical protein
MRIPWLLPVFFLVLLFVTEGNAQKCDCTIYPFRPDPPCFSTCMASLISNISEQDAKNILGLQTQLAKRVAGLASKGYQNLEAYDREMSAEEFRLFENRLRSLSPSQVDALRHR